MKNYAIHKIISVLLTVILLLGVFKTSFTISNFLINQDEIAKTLCVQKDNQQGCNGKCQLVKALKKDLEKDTKAPNSQNKKENIVLNFIKPTLEIKFSIKSKTISTKICDNRLYKTLDKKYPIFIPPPLVS